MTGTRPARRRRLLLGLGLAALAATLVAGGLVYRAPMRVAELAGRLTLRAHGFERMEATAARGPVTYFRAGRGPLLVFIHGVNDQAGTWARIAPAFTATHRVVVPDLAGHGDSAPLEGPLELGDLVDGLRAVVEAEASGGPAILVGNSLGAFLALVHASHHPDGVRLVVAINGAVMRGGNAAAVALLLPATREDARRMTQALTSPKTLPVPDFVLDDLVARTPHSPLARLAAAPPSTVDRWLLDDRLSTIQTPVVLIWGADDRLIPLHYAEEALERLPHATLETIPDCGHMPQRECPAALLPRLQAAIQAP